MPLPRTERTLELNLHNSTLEDIVAAHLYSMGFLRDAEVVLDISVGQPDNNLRPIRVTFIEERAVQLIKHK